MRSIFSGENYHRVEVHIVVITTKEPCAKIHELTDHLAKEVKEDINICFEGHAHHMAFEVSGEHLSAEEVVALELELQHPHDPDKDHGDIDEEDDNGK